MLTSGHYLFNPYAIPPILVGIFTLVLGFVVIVRERYSRVSIVFCLMTMSTSFWLLGIGMIYFSAIAPVALWWLRLEHLSVTFLPSLIYLFALAVTKQARRYRGWILLSFLGSALFYLSIFVTPWFIEGCYRYSWGFYAHYGFLTFPFLIFFFSCLLGGLINLWQAYRSAASPAMKSRMGTLCIAFAIGYLASIDYLPAYAIAVYPAGYLAVLACLLLAARAIWRYRLVDITPSFAANQIVVTMNDALIACDREGLIRLVNPAACRLFLYGETELLGKPIHLLSRSPFSLSNLSLGDQEGEWGTKEGEMIAVSASVALLENKPGEIDGVIFILRDIRERKRTEQIKKQQEALELANRHLQELAAMKDEFVATLNHELRIPLTAMRVNVDLLLREKSGVLNATQRGYLKTVDQHIQWLVKLIDNLLNLSKMEAGKLTLKRQRVSIQSLIDKVATTYQDLAGNRNVVLELQPTTDVLVDPDWMLQVLSNLFSNAVKFTEADGTIRLTTRQEGKWVVVAVADDGDGIAEGDLDKLFEKFSQVGRREDRPRGTGLGLALCKQLVEMHGGKISVISRFGEGATFTFRLPQVVQ